MLDFFGHIFYFCVLAGTYMIGRKNKWGWLVRSAGEAGWIIIGFILGMSSIWLWGFGFLAMEFWNFYKWCQDENKLSESEGTEASATHSNCDRDCVPGAGRGRCCLPANGERRCGSNDEPTSSEGLSRLR